MCKLWHSSGLANDGSFLGRYQFLCRFLGICKTVVVLLLILMFLRDRYRPEEGTFSACCSVRRGSKRMVHCFFAYKTMTVVLTIFTSLRLWYKPVEGIFSACCSSMVQRKWSIVLFALHRENMPSTTVIL